MIGLKKRNKPISFDELLKELQGAKSNEGVQNHVSFEMLFHETFMSRYSSFKCFNEFLRKGNFDVKTLEDVDNIPEELFDRHVDRETDFDSWKTMLGRANEEYEAGHRV
ncbi:hypothetical protein [Paenibacillus montanisoli]|uniref:hypothetical protein n=1 Tax=Paenibacillus montanisoli TaxID=2081970 RepID=UPI0026951D25